MKKGYRTGSRFYYAGFIIAICSLIAAELIWIPAPLRTGGGVLWIEMINWLYYVLALIPLSWALGAGRMLLLTPRLMIRSLRVAITVVNLVLAGLLIAEASITTLLAVLTAAAVLVIIDMLVSGRMERGRAPWRTIIWIAAMALILGILLVPTGYSVTYPGMTLDMNRYAHVQGGAEGGEIEGVLVFDRPAVLADRLYGWLFPQYDFLPVPKDEPPLSETYAQVIAMKTDANRVAAAIAMEKAGIGKGVVPDGIRIVAIVKDSPADGLLQAGDIVDAVNGNEMRRVEEMISYMTESVKPGDQVDLTVRRAGATVSVTVRTVPSDQEATRAVFGVSVQTEPKLDTPRSIDFHEYIAHLGGPSHGAMLTLAFIDQLVEGGVTGGLRVAGTGTIETDGSIGMVGGIPQKAYAVSRTDADVFFVPIEGEQAARSAAPDLRIVAVSNIDEVLEWLQEHKSEAQGK
ncbi:PDZ domain-containing protein [Paenibacillus sp. 1011MAR3C5]|uniref:PDZ domain-containing protein n=1 Tax=Paenibacillus sp. 1011MAR3C5 TaxID=1675787 RepID=UPI000E6CAD19|nr:PDZ domain-containing protein [Paenibacillus sp. 1011MAR3C5]RJE89777.1 PDZ domain-containing protein [Paenibacillus sp. 1011MAR3C5]